MDALADVREHLIQTDPQFRRLAHKHQEYGARLEELQAKRFPTEEERREEAELKKMKLQLKDQMEQMVRRARA